MILHSHRQLLLVDDQAQDRSVIVQRMQSRGFSMHVCESSAEGIEWLAHHHPFVVIAELRSAQVDGLAILNHINEQSSDIPLIFVSALTHTAEVVDVLRQGAADYILKPINDLSILDLAVDRALERSDLLLQNHVYRQELEQANRELKEYVRVLERDQKAGRSVQGKLLPDSPARFGDFSIEFKLIPSLYLSGDFIDYGHIADRYLAFYLTDVSGHGAASAFVTVWLKQLVRRFFREKKTFHTLESFRADAATLMALINREVIQSGVGCHMTCFVGVIDTHTREMRYVFGGHLPFPILISEGKAQYLTGKGKPVGIFPDATWEVYSTVLPQHFSLTVFSDGILEILQQEELIEKEKALLSIVEDNQNDVESLARAFGIPALASVPDDIAILKIQSPC